MSNEEEWVELDLTGNLTERWRLGPQNQSSEVAFTSPRPVRGSIGSTADGDKLVFAHRHFVTVGPRFTA